MNEFKGNEDMVRILAVAGAFLVMCIIIGISVHSIDRIDKANQITKDIEEGKQIASSIAQTQQTTNIWDILKNTTQPIEETTVEETLSSDESQLEGEEGSAEGEQESGETDAPMTHPPVETTVTTTRTSSTGFILHLD